MLASTLPLLVCPKPRCRSRKSAALLELDIQMETKLSDGGEDIAYGTLICTACKTKYPILAGVAVLVDHLRDYLLAHIKGISREVPEKHFPAEFRKEMSRAQYEIEEEHIEEDLESERVTALYLMTHYLGVEGAWWRGASREIEELLMKHWDHGPFERIRLGLREQIGKRVSLVELGCGVGGLLGAISGSLESYLGVDSAFAGISLARKLNLGTEEISIQVPGDLLNGTLSVDVTKLVSETVRSRKRGVAADFIVSDATAPPLVGKKWNVCASLNMIDMLDEPEKLARIQKSLLVNDGWAIQSSPYVWHPEAGKRLRKLVPDAQTSEAAVEKIYEQAGFSVLRSETQVPWLFYKHARQIELYSVHLFFARLLQLR